MTFDPTDKKKSDIELTKSPVSKAVSKTYKKYANGFQRPSMLLSLEPRMMFDGAAPAVIDDITDSTESGSSAESLPAPSTESPSDSSSDSSGLSNGSSGTESAGSENENLSVDDSSESELAPESSDPASELEGTSDLANEDDIEFLESTLDDLESTLDDLDLNAGLFSDDDTSESIDLEAEGTADGGVDQSLDSDSDGTLDYLEESELEEGELEESETSELDADESVGGDELLDQTSSDLDSETGDVNDDSELIQDESVSTIEAIQTTTTEFLDEEGTIDLNVLGEDLDVIEQEEQDVTRVVFIDTTVSGYEDLLAGLVADLEAQDAALNDDSEEGSSGDAVSDSISQSVSDLNADSTVVNNEAALIDDVSGDEASAADDATVEPLEEAVEQDVIYVNGVAIHLLRGEDNQIEQITETLGNYSDLSAIDIVSHGALGEVQLGSQRLSESSLDEYSDQIAQWGDALGENGDILLYGCNVAENRGQEFIDEFAELTGADVAASDDVTGNAAQGGDWELEVDSRY